MKIKSTIYGVIYFMHSGSLCKIGITHVGGLEQRKSRIENSLKRAGKIKSELNVYSFRVLFPKQFEDQLHDDLIKRRRIMPKGVSGRTEFFVLSRWQRIKTVRRMRAKSIKEHLAFYTLLMVVIYFLF